jgi:hypothetical protein
MTLDKPSRVQGSKAADTAEHTSPTPDDALTNAEFYEQHSARRDVEEFNLQPSADAVLETDSPVSPTISDYEDYAVSLYFLRFSTYLTTFV